MNTRRSGEADAWIEAIRRGIEEEIDRTGAPFVVVFPWPLGAAQEALVRELGVTPAYAASSECRRAGVTAAAGVVRECAAVAS